MGLKARASSKSRTKSTLKTRENSASVAGFVAGIKDARRKRDCETVLAMMKRVTGDKPKMWGTSIIGFGRYHYKNASGREGDWMRTGLSPRKASLTVYCMLGFKKQKDLLAKLGRHTHSVSCLYLPDLEQVDLKVLEAIIKRGYQDMAKAYPA